MTAFALTEAEIPLSGTYLITCNHMQFPSCIQHEFICILMHGRAGYKQSAFASRKYIYMFVM